MSDPKFSPDITLPETAPDEPDHDNCDKCSLDAWREGLPLWTCQGQLICEPCWSADAEND